MAVEYPQMLEKDIDPRELYGSDEEANEAKALYGTNQMSEVIEAFLKTDISKEYKSNSIINEFWAVLSRTIPLSFIEPEDIEEFEILFENAKIDFFMKRPPYMHTFDDMQLIDQLHIYFLSSLKRAVGKKGNFMNERTAQFTVAHNINRQNNESIGSAAPKGFFNFIRGNL